MNIYIKAKSIAEEAIEQVGWDEYECQEFIWQSCDSLDFVIYYGKAIEFCASHDTQRGEEFLEDTGGIQTGDTFGGIACKIAFGEIYLASMEVLSELLEEKENENV